MSRAITLYAVLGVDDDADEEAIRAAYRAAIKKCHPDVDASPSAHDLTLELIAAYEVLSDPERRASYDRALTSGAPFIAEAAPAAAVYSERAVSPLWWLKASLAAGGIMFGSFAVIFAIFLSLGLLDEERAPDLHSASAPQRADVTPVARPVAQVRAARPVAVEPFPVSRCLDRRLGLTGDDLYRQCVKERVKLHLLMMDAAPGAQLDHYKLEDALAEIRQADGAAQQNMSSVVQFRQEYLATFADIKQSARDVTVRRAAQQYYDCITVNRCVR